MSSQAETVEAYLAELPADRAADVAAVRDVVNANMPGGVVESMDYGMIAWNVEMDVSGPTDNGKPIMVAALAAQKNKLSLYLSAIYIDPETSAAFEAAWKAEVGSIDRGKSCVRFKTAEKAGMAAIAKVFAELDIEEFLGRCEAPR